jgi:hypothetical protein
MSLTTLARRLVKALYGPAKAPKSGWAPTAEAEFGDVYRVSPREPYARKGEAIICEKGHPIAVFTRTVWVGETFDVEALDFRFNQPPA